MNGVVYDRGVYVWRCIQVAPSTVPAYTGGTVCHTRPYTQRIRNNVYEKNVNGLFVNASVYGPYTDGTVYGADRIRLVRIQGKQ